MSDLLHVGYSGASVLRPVDGGQELSLATALGATPTGLVERPFFFQGFLARPDVAAAGLLAVADVAATKYVDLGELQRTANLDPVVTAGGDRLRFESFSGCNGVHARFDLLPEGLGSAEVGWGTTNVDVNQPLRSALAKVGRTEALHLSVGREELRAATLEATHVERRVRLPERWVRGLAEVSVIGAAMTPALTLTGAAARHLLGTLSRVKPPGPDVHLLPTPRGVRQTASAGPATVPLQGSARIRGADRLARFVTALAVHRHPSGATAWLIEVPGARLTLLLSATPYRGFSGEGGLLSLLCTPDVARIGTRLHEHLAWSPTVDAAALGETTGLTPAEVEAGLAWLAASGRLGYDLVDQAWFHRELPVDADAVLRRNPRLRKAQRLADDGSVVASGDGGWLVAGSEESYRLDRDATTCTCRWTEESPDRGPCSHRLAVLLHRTSSE
ncbi:SWIM zinc finger family protein [Nocardioides sp. GXZ039]|uniref:SWIM zinc finger family protein n=1 Tax=Nocardioides sp. GXZ039 TaxID=3136018 RepID=UPI0030F39026